MVLRIVLVHVKFTFVKQLQAGSPFSKGFLLLTIVNEFTIGK